VFRDKPTFFLEVFFGLPPYLKFLYNSPASVDESSTPQSPITLVRRVDKLTMVLGLSLLRRVALLPSFFLVSRFIGWLFF